MNRTTEPLDHIHWVDNTDNRLAPGPWALRKWEKEKKDNLKKNLDLPKFV